MYFDVGDYVSGYKSFSILNSWTVGFSIVVELAVRSSLIWDKATNRLRSNRIMAHSETADCSTNIDRYHSSWSRISWRATTCMQTHRNTLVQDMKLRNKYCQCNQDLHYNVQRPHVIKGVYGILMLHITGMNFCIWNLFLLWRLLKLFQYLKTDRKPSLLITDLKY